MSLKEYRRTTEEFPVTPDVIEDFHRAGYIVVRNLLDAEEVDKLKHLFENNKEIQEHTFTQADGDHSRMTVCAWNYPGNDVSGMIARSEKYAGTCEKLLGGEVYLYHAKLTTKEPVSGGKMLWHQDYGYWYKSGNLYPDMMTVFTAIDPCIRDNGCLQVLEGSHRCGRIDHSQVGEQQEANGERVQQLLDSGLTLHTITLQPGDAVLYHCNLLHHSDRNTSQQRRSALAVIYNKASNSSVVEHHHAQYNPLNKVPNSAIRQCTNFTDMSGKGFMVKQKADWYDAEAEKADM